MPGRTHLQEDPPEQELPPQCPRSWGAALCSNPLVHVTGELSSRGWPPGTAGTPGPETDFAANTESTNPCSKASKCNVELPGLHRLSETPEHRGKGNDIYCPEAEAPPRPGTVTTAVTPV